MSMGLPMPARRFAVAGCLAFALVLILHTFAPSTLPPALTPSYAHHEPDASYFSPGKWLPPIFNPNAPERPPEFDENGQCLFLSPYDALSDEEKRRAETMVLEEVSPGVSRLVETTSPAWDQDVSALEAPYRRWMRNRQYGGDDDYAATASAGTGGDGSDLPRLTTPVGKSHPILGLLRHGDQKWKRMVESQSKTLDEAVDKYMSKWNRPPPKGFDLWWQFARSHKVLLPDELDSIMHALLPFYGLPIDTLQERLKEVEKIPETFTLIAHDGKIELQWNDDYARDTWFATRTRADKQINLMEPFLHMVGNFRATHTIHDQPTILLDHDRAAELINAAMARKVAPHHVEEDKHVVDWRGACAKSDPINTPDFLELPAADTFITNHAQAMNICHHPSYLENHGMLLEQKGANDHPMPHTKLYPIFVPSTTVLNRDIPVTPDGNDLGHDAVGHDPEWSRKSGKLYWRGKATGMNHNKKSGSKWRQSHRERLHFLANDRKKRHEEVLTPVGNTGQVETATYPLKELGDYYMDVKLSGGHWQCDWDDGTCSEMNDEIKWGSDDSSETSNWYKYVFDIDGNAWSSRFPRLMSSNNVVIKASVFPEWNTQSLPEWFAYVPSKMDYSDLFSILAFFRGTPSGKGSHDEVARRIALNGQCWVEKTWRTEDKQAYMFLLYLEYARVVSLDRDNGKMDFKVSAKHRPAFETELKEEKLAASMDDEVSKVRPDMDKSDPLAPGDFIEVDDDLSAAGGKVGSGTAESNANRVPDALSDEYLE